MQVLTQQLWEDQEQVTLTAYLTESINSGLAAKKKPAIIICPGGSYLYTSEREAEPVALRFASMGYQTFVLHYNTYFGAGAPDYNQLPPPNIHSKFPQPLYDLAMAVKLVRENANEWNVNGEQITVAGFSAGGHLAASLGVHWQEAFLSEKLSCSSEVIKPNALILGYALLDCVLMMDMMSPAEQQAKEKQFQLMYQAVMGTTNVTNEMLVQFSPAKFVSVSTPPAFIWHATDDTVVSSANSLQFALEMTKYGIPYELHVYEQGGHGISLGDITTAARPEQLNEDASKWVQQADRWLKRRFTMIKE